MQKNNSEIINQLDSDIKELERKIAQLKIENEITKLNIQKKEIILLKTELEQSN